MAKNQYIQFKCIAIKQPIGQLYIGAIDSKDLVYISYADVRRIENEDRDVERYLGIQRPLSKHRVKELHQYVNLIDATFPTSVILALSSENTIYDDSKSIMKIKKGQDIAKVIDGQHRIAGLEEYQGDKFLVNITVFVDMDIEDQAMVFSTINLKHTKVSKSLAYDLFDFARKRSPQKTCHNIAKLLNTKKDSPFNNKIKILGVATGKVEETLTQATFVESLMNYISTNPLTDRDLIKRGKNLQKVTGEELKNRFFRNMFIEEKDAELAKIIWNYFMAVQIRWKSAWNSTSTGIILNRNTGFRALMRFLKPVYLSFNSIGSIVEKEQYLSIFKKIKLGVNEFNTDNYKPGSSGEGALFRELCKQSGLKI